MALFEPTNITPDEKGAFGNGVVDITKGLAVSWQVNGNAATPMTGCSITIMENNAESTFVYETPIETINPPFYPTDEKGIPIPYTTYIPYDILVTGRTYEVESSTITVTAVNYDTLLEKVGQKGRYTFSYNAGSWHLAGGAEPDIGIYGISYTGTPQNGDVISVVCGSGMHNGSEYKLQITQLANRQVVTQKSASVFLTRSTPSLTINGFDLPVSSKKYTFAATYKQAQEDALMWARWQLASVSEQGERTEVYDTGRMYGVAVLELTADGLMPGSSYSVRCSGETVNGVMVDSGWEAFLVQYSFQPTGGDLSARCAAGADAVRLSLDTEANKELLPQWRAENYNVSYYRKGRSTLLQKLFTLPITQSTALDYSAVSQQGPYTYYAFLENGENFLYAPLTSAPISPCWWNWTLLSCAPQEDGTYLVEREFRFRDNVATREISNGNSPSVLQNFTRYPTVQRAPQNCQSGTLTALIGVASKGAYADTIEQRNAIWALSTTQNTLFLKNRKGDLMMVAISGEITMQTGDNTPQQTQTATIPWVEVGSAENVALYALSDK